MIAIPRRVLIDTGPLVAWVNAAQSHHLAVRRLLDGFEGQLLCTWPVVTETCHLIPEHLVAAFLRWAGSGGLTIVEIPAGAMLAMADRIEQYADLPMDFADASLIWLADSLGVLDIITLDQRDFGIYRTQRGRALRNLLDLKSTPSSATRPRPSRARSRAR